MLLFFLLSGAVAVSCLSPTRQNVRLASLGEVEALVQRRAEHRSRREFKEADGILETLAASNVRIRDEADGTSTWSYETAAHDDNVLHIAKRARAAATDVESDKEHALIVRQCDEEALAILDGAEFVALRDLPGRQAADAAFAFAMAGSLSEAVFERLGDVAAEELRRVYFSGSRRKRQVFPGSLATLHIAEKFAAAGLRADHNLFTVAAEVTDDFVNNDCPFLAPRALIWRWRYSATKQARDPQRPLKPEVPSSFDLTRPLTIDLGCGFGTSTIGLALSEEEGSYVGVDSSAACVRAARGFAVRLGVSKRCVFLRSTAEDALKWALDYEVRRILVQFPTPCSLAEPDKDVRGKAFMFTPELIKLLEAALDGELYVSSNVEDVASRIFDLLDAVFQPHCEQPQPEKEPATRRVSRREQRLLLLEDDSGSNHAAPWLTRSPLPDQARSETEAILTLKDQPVYRMLFTKNDKLR